jgi:GT2 family glycosyltransferase
VPNQLGDAIADYVILQLAASCGSRFGGMRAAPLVSVIVPVYDHWDATAHCLASVALCDPEIALELIVVDDASTDETPEALARLPGVKVLRNMANEGFVYSCNRGAAVAGGSYLFFLNNDTQLYQASIAALVRRIESDDTIGIVGSKLIYPMGALQEAGGIIWSDGFAWNYGHGDDAGRSEYNFTRDVDYVSGAALLVRAAFFFELGSFDERYAPAYYEDADLCFAARAAGKRVVYEPASVVMHHEGLTAGHDVGAGMKRFYAVNHPKFTAKWGDVLRHDHLEYAMPKVRLAARRRGAVAHHAVLVAGPTLGPPGETPNRLGSLARSLFDAGARVVCFPGDLEPVQPSTARLQSAGIEVIVRTGGDERTARDHLDEVLATVDAAIVVGVEACRMFLPAIRAQSGVPVLYDAPESERSNWYGDDLNATCIRAADGTFVRSEGGAGPVLDAGFGPVAIVPMASAPEIGDALSLIEQLVATGRAVGSDVESDRDQTQAAELSAAKEDLEREREAHRQTSRREAQTHLERANAEKELERKTEEAARIERRSRIVERELSVLTQRLVDARSLACAQGAEFAASDLRQRLEVAAKVAQVTALRAKVQIERQKGRRLTAEAAELRAQVEALTVLVELSDGRREER